MSKKTQPRPEYIGQMISLGLFSLSRRILSAYSPRLEKGVVMLGGGGADCMFDPLLIPPHYTQVRAFGIAEGIEVTSDVIEDVPVFVPRVFKNGTFHEFPEAASPDQKYAFILGCCTHSINLQEDAYNA